MKNLKFIAAFSIFGFLLSIFSSFHTVARSAGSRFLIALCFALGFGVLAAAIQFLGKKFIFAETSGDFSEAGNKSSNSANASSGTHPVDIVVQDEELPAEDGGPQFFVGSNHQMLNNEDLQDVKKNDTEPQKTVTEKASEITPGAQNSAMEQVRGENSSSGNSGFVPLNFAENPSNISSVESKSMDELKSDEKSARAEQIPSFDNNSENDSETLDVLPDLETISDAAQLSVSSENSGFSENSNFSENKDTNSASSAGSSKEKSSGQDAELMAKAISTLLSKDN